MSKSKFIILVTTLAVTSLVVAEDGIDSNTERSSESEPKQEMEKTIPVEVKIDEYNTEANRNADENHDDEERISISDIESITSKSDEIDSKNAAHYENDNLEVEHRHRHGKVNIAPINNITPDIIISTLKEGLAVSESVSSEDKSGSSSVGKIGAFEFDSIINTARKMLDVAPLHRNDGQPNAPISPFDTISTQIGNTYPNEVKPSLLSPYLQTLYGTQLINPGKYNAPLQHSGTYKSNLLENANNEADQNSYPYLPNNRQNLLHNSNTVDVPFYAVDQNQIKAPQYQNLRQYTPISNAFYRYHTHKS